MVHLMSSLGSHNLSKCRKLRVTWILSGLLWPSPGTSFSHSPCFFCSVLGNRWRSPIKRQQSSPVDLLMLTKPYWETNFANHFLYFRNAVCKQARGVIYRHPSSHAAKLKALVSSDCSCGWNRFLKKFFSKIKDCYKSRRTLISKLSSIVPPCHILKCASLGCSCQPPYSLFYTEWV